MKNAGVRFTNARDRQFALDVKRAVKDYFEDNDIDPKATPGMWVQAVVTIALIFVPYGLILSGALPLWGMWLCCIAMAVGVASYGFGVMHDAVHGTYSKHKLVNWALGFVFDITGASSYLWRLRHNVMHHSYTNIYGADVDLDANWVLRLSPYAKHYPVQRYQHWYFPLAYAISSLHWILFKDYKSLSMREHGCFRDVTHSRGQIALLIGMKAVHYFLFIGLPLLVLDVTVGQFLVGFLTLHVVTGLIMTLTFQVTHNVDITSKFLSEPGKKLQHSWMVHEVLVSANFACDNPLVTWFVGGPNHQIEHHLFPHVAHAHLPAIRPIVKRVIEEHGLPYHEFPTYRAALGGHRRLLKELGAAPEVEGYAVPVAQAS